jgi:AhpD family alkylhydroperoxidase
MPRVSLPAPEDAPEVRALLASAAQRLAGVTDVVRAAGHAPELGAALVALLAAAGRTQLDPGLRELACMAASRANGCGPCLEERVARAEGVRQDQVEALDTFDEHEEFDDLERDVMSYATELTRRCHADAYLVERLRVALGERELVELTLVVGLANLTDRVVAGLDL